MIIPPKLKKGDEIRIIAPARSLSLVGKNNAKLAQEQLEKAGYTITFSKNVWEIDDFQSSSIQSRLSDLHEAFLDTNVKAILTVIGGYNTNQLLDFIDYKIIQENPKILCGFSDITALANAITTKTNMITYSGLHFSTWAMQQDFEYNKKYFDACLTKKDSFIVHHSKQYSDDLWFLDQNKRTFIEDDSYWILNAGKAQGKIVGGHVRCLACLQGTQYMPKLKDSILFLEEDAEINGALFDRLLQSLIQQHDFDGVKGIVIGRFQTDSKITKDILTKIIKTKPELDAIPVMANADFGHTNPLITFPIGGKAILDTNEHGNLEIIEH